MTDRTKPEPGRGRWDALVDDITACRRCPRLLAHCREVARVKRRAFRDEVYWGKPVPGFGDHEARLLIVGLAPAAHGANRTGRMFTGDDSGNWLYRALHRAGLATSPEAGSRDDGLELRGAFITATCRCAPPDNKPTPAEMDACAIFLDREIELIPEVDTVFALGKIAWDAVLRRARRADPGALPRPLPRFAHGAETRVSLRAGAARVRLVGSYHPSRQNTSTGRLTEPMLDAALALAKKGSLGATASRR